MQSDNSTFTYRTSKLVHSTSYSDGDDHSPVEAVVYALSKVTGADPLNTSPVHYEVDMDVVKCILSDDSESDNSPDVAAFTVGEYELYVLDGGHIQICDPSTQTDPQAVHPDQTD